jgi:hypothetical protein
VGLDWASEIREGIAKTAAFVAVMSPSYQNSDWCTRELTSFLGTEGSLESVKAGDLSRFLKIVKIPWENNDHEAFFPRLQHVQFFRRVDGPQEYVEYPIGSENFQACLQEAAASITAVLRTMRRRLQMRSRFAGRWRGGRMDNECGRNYSAIVTTCARRGE